MRYSYAVALFIALLAGCAKNVVQPNKLVPLVGKIGVKQHWQQRVGEGLGETYRVIPPVFRAGRIFANDIAGNVFAYDAESGNIIWRQRLNIDTASGLGVGSNAVLFASLHGDVISFATDTGEEQWRVNIRSEILAPPQTNDRVVVVQTGDDKLIGLDANNGEILWDFSVNLPSLSLRGTATPLLFGDNLVAGFANGKLMAFSAVDGTLFWERRIARPQGRSDIERVVDIDGQPIVAGSVIYSTSYNGTLSALSPTGNILWSQDVSSHGSPVVADGRIFVTAENGVVRAFDTASGAPLWENSSLFRRKLSAPQNFNGFVVVADFEGYVHIFDSETGEIIARQQVDGAGVRSSMIAADDTLYVLGNDGVLAALEVRLLDPKNLPEG